MRKFTETIQAWWIAAAKGAVKRLPMRHKLLSNLKWLQPGLQQSSMAGQVLAAAECVPQIVQVGDKPAFRRNLSISARHHYLLKSRPSQRWISIGMQSAKSKTARKLSIATPHWENSQKPYLSPLAMLIPNVYSATLVSTKRSTETD